jgi:hypothetical protein
VVSALGSAGAAVLSSDTRGKLDNLPLISTGGERAERQPSAVLLRNASVGRSGCLHAGTQSVCSPDQATRSAPPGGLSDSVRLPQAATYHLRGTALPQDGDALERLLSVPGAMTATASSRAVTAPEGRPNAAVDRDLGTGWLAAPDDPSPRLALTLPQAREIHGLRFRAHALLNGSRPADVVLHFDGGAPVPASVDADGFVRFGPRRARTVTIDFTATQPVQDARTSPVGVTEVEVLGADDLRKTVAPQRRVPSYCGNGPLVRIDDVPMRTQIAATLQDLLRRRPVAFSLCGQDAVPLRSGLHHVDVQANGGVVPVETALVKAGFGDVSVAPVDGVDVWRPNPAELTVEVPTTDGQSVLTVAQNYNEGWTAYDSSGTRLTPIRVGGWQQGWVLPGGPEQVVTARFTPDRTYRAGLLLGLVTMLGVVAVAVFFPRRMIGRSTR